MNPETRLALNAINRDFYAAEGSAASFSATRDHPWPGWEGVWREARRDAPAGRALSLLDAGCGNGRFAAFLAERMPPPVHYLGIDASQPLLDTAAQRAQPLARAQFLCSDLLSGLTELGGPSGLNGLDDHSGDATGTPAPPRRFDAVVLFGVLHHIPCFETRVALLAALAARVAQGGILAFTLWRFGEPSLWPRFRSRVLPWQDYNRGASDPLDLSQLETGDHLLRWGDRDASTAGPLRYCHYVDDAEREALVKSLPLETVQHYTEDGRSHDLNEYLVLRATR